MRMSNVNKWIHPNPLMRNWLLHNHFHSILTFNSNAVFTVDVVNVVWLNTIPVHYLIGAFPGMSDSFGFGLGHAVLPKCYIRMTRRLWLYCNSQAVAIQIYISFILCYINVLHPYIVYLLTKKLPIQRKVFTFWSWRRCYNMGLLVWGCCRCATSVTLWGWWSEAGHVPVNTDQII
jgi:hypothetical protein